MLSLYIGIVSVVFSEQIYDWAFYLGLGISIVYCGYGLLCLSQVLLARRLDIRDDDEEEEEEEDIAIEWDEDLPTWFKVGIKLKLRGSDKEYRIKSIRERSWIGEDESGRCISYSLSGIREKWELVEEIPRWFKVGALLTFGEAGEVIEVVSQSESYWIGKLCYNYKAYTYDNIDNWYRV